MPDETPDLTLPVPAATLEAGAQACATLLPFLKGRLRQIASGEILEVRADDAAAREGVPAFCRMTGHALVRTVEDGPERTRFFIRKR